MAAYATADELARTLKLRNPTAEQTAAMERVLTMATVEINAEIGRPEVADDPIAGDDLALVEQVCLQRAAELWGLQEWPLGLAGVGGELPATTLARNSWQKYSFTLAPLRREWGIA